jgi:hypothetical protein
MRPYACVVFSSRLGSSGRRAHRLCSFLASPKSNQRLLGIDRRDHPGSPARRSISLRLGSQSDLLIGSQGCARPDCVRILGAAINSGGRHCDDRASSMAQAVVAH